MDRKKLHTVFYSAFVFPGVGLLIFLSNNITDIVCNNIADNYK